MSVKAIPEGFSTIIPYLAVSDAAKAIELYKKAFGAKEATRMLCPSGSGKIMHACLEIGSSKLFLSDVNPQMGAKNATSSSFYLYMDNVDATFAQAKKAGLEEVMAVQDMFWGDRMGNLKDPFGNLWSVATHVREVSKEEMAEGAKKMMGKAA